MFPGSKEKGNIVLYVPFKGSDQEVGIVLASALLSYIVAFQHPIPIRTIVLRAHVKKKLENGAHDKLGHGAHEKKIL